MSDRPRRRSPPRGRSKSRTKSRGRYPSPPLDYKETTTRTVHKYATQTQSYQDHYSGQASRSDALEYHDKESGQEDYDDETDSDREDHERKRQGIMNVMEKLTQPDGELTKEKLKYLINEYRTCDQKSSDEDEEDDYDRYDDDTEEESDNNTEDESDYENDESGANNSESESESETDNKSEHEDQAQTTN